MILEGFHDLRDIFLGLVVLVFHGIQLVGVLFEKAEEAFFLLLCRVKAFELRHHAGKHIAHLAEILRPDVFQSRLGKISHFLLCSGPVLKDHIVVGQVDLLREAVHHFPLIIVQNALIKSRFDCLRSGSCRNFRLFLSLSKGIQAQSRRCFQIF